MLYSCFPAEFFILIGLDWSIDLIFRLACFRGKRPRYRYCVHHVILRQHRRVIPASCRFTVEIRKSHDTNTTIGEDPPGSTYLPTYLPSHPSSPWKRTTAPTYRVAKSPLLDRTVANCERKSVLWNAPLDQRKKTQHRTTPCGTIRGTVCLGNESRSTLRDRQRVDSSRDGLGRHIYLSSIHPPIRSPPSVLPIESSSRRFTGFLLTQASSELVARHRNNAIGWWTGNGPRG